MIRISLRCPFELKKGPCKLVFLNEIMTAKSTPGIAGRAKEKNINPPPSAIGTPKILKIFGVANVPLGLKQSKYGKYTIFTV